jgi:hypothetical protein
MSDPKKTKYNPQGSYHVEALWRELLRSFGRGKGKIVMNDAQTSKQGKRVYVERNP